MPQSLPEGDDQSSRASLQQLTKLMCAHAMQTHHEELSDKPWHSMTHLQNPHSLHYAGHHTPRMAKRLIFRTAVIPLRPQTECSMRGGALRSILSHVYALAGSTVMLLAGKC